jgi:uncharacterized protein YggE
MDCSRPCLPPRRRSLLAGLLLPALLAGPAPVRAEAQVQLRCDGTVLEARGAAEQQRPIQRLQLSLGLEAEAPAADGALALLQQRLAAERSALQQLQVEELRVSSPSSWQRPAEPRRPAQVQASLQLTGRLAPRHLQVLVREVGALPGVRLAPVTPEADRALGDGVRRQLLRQAYQDARAQAAELAAAIGLQRLLPLEVRLDGLEGRPMPMMARMADAPPPPFDPAELPRPLDRLTMQVRFCAR